MSHKEPATKVLINLRMCLTWTIRSCPDSSKADKASQYSNSWQGNIPRRILLPCIFLNFKIGERSAFSRLSKNPHLQEVPPHSCQTQVAQL